MRYTSAAEGTMRGAPTANGARGALHVRGGRESVAFIALNIS